MEFKRFGGEYHRTGDGGGNFNIAIFGLISLIICSILALFIDTIFMFFGFGLLFFFMIVSALIPGGSTQGFRQLRFQKRLKEATSFYESGQLLRALAAIKLAKAHGELPLEIAQIEQDIEKQLDA